MNLWQTFERNGRSEFENNGFSLHFEKGIAPDFRRKCLTLARWLRGMYFFPIHLNIYIKNCEKIRLLSGAMAYGGFRYGDNKPPYIRIPAKIDEDLLCEYTVEELHEQILSSLVHELTHYYQFVLDLDQSNAASERQADYFRYRIIERFYDCVGEESKVSAKL